MTIQERLYTVAEFVNFSQLPENAGRRLELINGEVIEMAPSSQENTLVAARLIRLLGDFVETQELGYVTATDGGFELGPDTVLIPDGAFFGGDKRPVFGEVTFPFAPDLAIEVVSPKSESPRKIRHKIERYIKGGTRLVWAVYPLDREVEVWQPGPDEALLLHTLRPGDVLNGGEVLPGFALPLERLFRFPGTGSNPVSDRARPD